MTLKNSKVIIIGLDGMNWELIHYFFKLGKLNVLKKIINQGAYGNLESTFPPVTGPAWTSFATGKKPSEHKCYDFFLFNQSLSNFSVISSKKIHGKTFYETVEENNKIPIIINLPNSYPPKIKNPMITSLLTRGNQFIFPENLKSEIPELKKYKLITNTTYTIKEQKTKALREIIEIEKDRFAGIKKLYQKNFDLFFYMFSGTDWIQHLCRNEILKGQNKLAEKYFEDLDNYLAWLIDHKPKNADFLIMSDHGFHCYPKAFYLNKWLQQEGFLQTKAIKENRNIGGTVRSQALEKHQNSIFKIKLNQKKLGLLGKNQTVMNILRFIYKKILIKIIPLSIKENEDIDYAKTKACFPVCSYYACIYINDKKRFQDGVVKDQDFAKIKQEIKAKLEKFSKINGEIFKKIYLREELYPESKREDKIADIFFELKDHYFFKKFLAPNLIEDKLKNGHALQGIFLGFGSNIKQGIEIKDAKIYQLAPFILKLLNLNQEISENFSEILDNTNLQINANLQKYKYKNNSHICRLA